MRLFACLTCSIVITCLSGCGDLKLPNLEDTETPVADEVPAVVEQPATPAVSLSPQQLIDSVVGKNSRDITDADLAQLAALESGLENITELNLRSATISSESFKSMASFPAIKKLNMEATRLTDPNWNLLSGVKSLEWLNVTRSAVNDAYMKHIADLPQLQYLSLTETVVTDNGLNALINQSQLTEIDVSATEINGSGFAALGQKGARAPIRVVRAARSQIGYQGFIYFKEFPGLEEVYASGSSVTDGSMEGLKRNTKLRVLDISGNMVTDTGLKNLSGAKGLEELNVKENRNVTDASLKRLQKYPKLVKLNINKTTCTVRGVESLKKALPDCEVYFMQKTF